MGVIRRRFNAADMGKYGHFGTFQDISVHFGTFPMGFSIMPGGGKMTINDDISAGFLDKIPVKSMCCDYFSRQK